MSGCTGTLRYMAPEILFNNGEDYNLKIDIYSLGLNFWYIITGKIPLEELDKNPNAILLLREGFRPNIREIKNIDLQKLINRMWDTIPVIRPDIKEVLDKVNIIVENLATKKNKCLIM